MSLASTPFALHSAQLQPFVAPALVPGMAVTCLTLCVATTTVAFSGRYMRADLRPRAYFSAIGIAVASVLTFATTGNIAVFVAAWIASGVALARLIGHAHQLGDTGPAMRRAGATFATGDAALVGAMTIAGWHAGSLHIATALAATATLPPAFALMAALLVVIAATARCAVPPFSGWLLSSMTAPTPVSALMHAGLVNAGGLLLLRFEPLLTAAPLARMVAAALGLAGALYGLGIMAVRPDIKRSLAGSTVSQMGFMIVSCALGAYAAALWHILAHGLFKAWLFLGSGSAIGMKPAGPTRDTAVLPTPVIAAVTLGLALVAAGAGVLDAGMVPLALALATILSTLGGALTGSVRGRIALGLACAGLVALYAGALRITHAALGPDAPALLPTPALLAVLAGFLGAWVWQQRRGAGGLPLPPALYVRLLNAGALAAPSTGAV